MTDPGIRTLVRPVITVRPASAHAKIVTVDWDELAELAELAEEAVEPDGLFDVPDKYAQGVCDALRWTATGVPTAALLELLGGR
jgi:hypothetical protein